MRKETLLNFLKATFSLFFALTFSTSVISQPYVGYQPLITEDLSAPMEVASIPGDLSDRLFIVQKSGVISIWDGEGIIATPFLNIEGLVADDDERGLLSMAFHPQYQTNGFFYVYYNNQSNGNIKVARYFANPAGNVATAGSRVEIFDTPKPFSNHNGGHLQFKVEGGVNYLYFATGDGGDGNDPQRNAQNPNSRLGKMIRMDVDSPSPTVQIWAWGLRNPFRWSFDRATGDMWIGDVGQGLREEVNFRAAGTSANYGWPCFEGTLSNGPGQSGSRCDTVGAVDVLPIFEYNNPPSSSTSVVGGYVYRGTAYPALVGTYMVTDYYSGQMWLIRPNGVGGWNVVAQPNSLPSGISSISETGDGELYAVSLNAGTVSRIVEAIVTPVSLVNFSGRLLTGYNELKWTTASETSIQKYIVEYSTNGRDYLSAGEETARYQDGGAYTFQHRINPMERIFYRLKIVEMDGRSYYSPIISLGKRDVTRAVVYPTVITNGQVSINASEGIEQLEIFSTNGARVYAKNLNGQSGFLSISLPGLAKGMYLLQLNGKTFKETSKIIIQ